MIKITVFAEWISAGSMRNDNIRNTFTVSAYQ